MSSVPFRLNQQIFRQSELGRCIVKCERDNCPEGTLQILSTDLEHKSSLPTRTLLHKSEILGSPMAHLVSHQRTWSAITYKLPAIRNDYDVAVER